MPHILAIDQGTTSSRAIIFDGSLKPIASAQAEFTQFFPHSGHVEHDAEEIWKSVITTARAAIAEAKLTAKEIAAIGITNQRETTILWDKQTGAPIHKAIVWQDRRTADYCDQLKAQGHEATIQEISGLLLDPYFSASKIAWMLDHVEGAREKAEQGKLAFGTIDSFLIWKLTDGKQYVTDATNASRTMLYDIGKGQWSAELLKLFNIPASLLPDVRDCAADFGQTAPEIFGAPIAILGVAGDQHAATIGQACFKPGMMKSTYGTGCFAMLNTGPQKVKSNNRLLTTIAYQLNGQTTYALEGSIFIAGAVVQWLRDGLKAISHAKQTDALAQQADPEQNVIIVPAFTGLGAPYWNPHCRGAIFGLTRNSGPAELARAALESVGFQTRDLLEAMQADWNAPHQTALRVDGGMSVSEPAMQFLADIIASPVDRPHVLETTAMGAAWLAGFGAGLLPGMDEFAKNWQAERRFFPEMLDATREDKYLKWKKSVAATLSV